MRMSYSVLYNVRWTKECFYFLSFLKVFLPYEHVSEKQKPCHSIYSTAFLYIYKYSCVILLCPPSSALQTLLSRDMLSNKTTVTTEGIFIFIEWAISIFYVSVHRVFMCVPCASVLCMAGAAAGL